jgi:hypothetical protein
LTSVNAEKLEKTFKVEYNQDVYRLSLNEFGNFPHLAAAYLDERKQLLIATAMTEMGFKAIVDALNKNGINISEEPLIRIHPSMQVTAELVLNKTIQLNPYEKLFAPESTPGQQEELEKINQFLQSVLPILDSGGSPDIEALAKQAGIDPATARQLMEISLAKMEELKKGGRK